MLLLSVGAGLVIVTRLPCVSESLDSLKLSLGSNLSDCLALVLTISISTVVVV